MRKLSELITRALPHYIDRANCCDMLGVAEGAPGMCNVMSELHSNGLISTEENSLFYNWIRKELKEFNWLHWYLKDKGLPCNRAARIQWYKDKIAKLESEDK
jgi:hypothetical protein